jgi:hypothetical protein
MLRAFLHSFRYMISPKTNSPRAELPLALVLPAEALGAQAQRLQRRDHERVAIRPVLSWSLRVKSRMLCRFVARGRRFPPEWHAKPVERLLVRF